MPRIALRPVRSALVALCGLVLVTGIVRAEEGGGSPPPSSVAVFDELYVRLPEASEPAEELRFRLKADLIRSDAEIEILKLEAARASGARQAEVLADLVGAAAARERRVWLAIRQLEQLAGQAANPAPAPEPAAVEDPRRESMLQITMEAQDLTKDPDP